MRTRKEIREEYSRDLSTCTVETYGQNKLILEVLLDIRELIEQSAKKKGRVKTE